MLKVFSYDSVTLIIPRRIFFKNLMDMLETLDPLLIRQFHVQTHSYLNKAA